MEPFTALVAPTWCLSFFQCDCPDQMWHAEECWTTPIYAELVEELGSPWGWLTSIAFGMYVPRYVMGDNE